MKISVITLAVASVFNVSASGSSYAAADSKQPLMINIKRLSMYISLRIAKAAIEHCRKEGVQVAVTVVDRGGHEKIVLRDTLAMDIATSIRKKGSFSDGFQFTNICVA